MNEKYAQFKGTSFMSSDSEVLYCPLHVLANAPGRSRIASENLEVIMKLWMAALCICALAVTTWAADAPGRSLPLDQDKTAIWLDDMYFSPALGKVLVPSGRTGKLELIDPATGAIDSISGFGTEPPAGGGRGAGPTSVDEAGKLLLVTDRSLRQLDVVDPRSRKIVSSVPLEAGPDYVRHVKSTNEIWVTEPAVEKIEIFGYPEPSAKPAHTGVIEVKGGPEALAIDNARGVAYTNIDGGKTSVIELKSRKIIHEWSNGCEEAEGALLNDSGELLFVACREGKVVAMNPDDGKVVSTVSSGAGIDIIAYNAKLRHIYAPGSQSATVAVISVSEKGELSVLRTLPSVERGHCVVADSSNNFYVCDPTHAGLLVYKDTP